MIEVLVDNRSYWLFGFEFPVLPDFLSDHTLLGEKPDQRIEEHCRRWTQFVGGLWTDEDVLYSLRYKFEPTSERSGEDEEGLELSISIGGRIRLQLIVRMKSRESAIASSKILNIRLREFGFRPNLLDGDYLQEEKLQRFKWGLEVRQRDTRILTRMNDVCDGGTSNHHYLVLPWWGPGGPFLVPVQVLCSQQTPVILNIILRPTILKEGNDANEMAYISGKAAFGKTQAGTTRSLDTQGKSQDHSADPQAEWLGRIYAAQLRRLDQPFLITCHCFSNSQTAVRAVAKALASGISEEVPYEKPIGEVERLQSQAEVVPLEGEDLEHAIEGYRLGSLSANQYEKASIGRMEVNEKRLRYLVDARGAATVFRFPVNVRGGVPGFEVRQMPPDYNPGPPKPGDSKNIILGCRSSGDPVIAPLKNFAKHALITGFTGSGKTNTVLHLLEQLWRDHGIPFLVIESAKAEYRGLITVRDRKGQKNGFAGYDEKGRPKTRIYTLGNESCAPFRLNPFELQPGVRLESHIGRLQACFEAALPQEGPLPAMLSDAILMIYERLEWKLQDEGPQGDSPFPFPTMRDLRDMLMLLLKPPGPENRYRGRGYQGEILANVQGFVSGRVSPLLEGSKGLMFDTPRSVPLKELFTIPTILELNDLNEADKGMVVMFLLTLLREYRETDKQKNLVHVTVVEEAHNVLANTRHGASQSASQEKAVQSFCNMLAEIRALGEGLIIADQSPEKLARDAIRNTNVQVTHQLRDSVDRDVIADCILMSDEQREYLGKIELGWAACFFTGSEKATFVKVPQFEHKDPSDPYSGRGEGFGVIMNGLVPGNIEEADVKRHMWELTKGYIGGPLGASCVPCQSKCKFRKDIIKGRSPSWTKKARQDYDAIKQDPSKSKELDKNARTSHVLLADMTRKKAGLDLSDDSLWCAYAHLAPENLITKTNVAGHYKTIQKVAAMYNQSNSSTTAGESSAAVNPTP